ncbi:MAG TPA: diaminopimelate epimerase [Rhizomicrobium sp.]|jgi:diaminopimelate epimerase|nr:diaminopimelate epimerase [Rhizomicrobium sp.]
MIPFRKMQGLGNDFVVFDARQQAIPMTSSRAKAIADRHFGVGCDTLVLITPGDAQVDARLRFFNADGGEVESCGNATRCVARLLMDERGLARVKLDSKGGMLIGTDAGHGFVTVDVGIPKFDWRDIPLAEAADTSALSIPVDSRDIAATAVLMGNPHCILFVEDAEHAPVTELGPKLETHALFPTRINVEFAHVHDPRHIRMRVWERGIGVTLACGTGACATAVAAMRKGLAERKVEVELDGGKLIVEWREADGHVLMTGPGKTVFLGEIDLDAYGH